MASPILTNMEFTRLRGLGVSPTGRPLLQLMDSVDESKVLLLIELQPGPQIAAMDISGNEIFTTTEEGKGLSYVWMQGNPVGKVVKSKEVKRTFLEPFTDNPQDTMILKINKSAMHYSTDFVDVNSAVVGSFTPNDLCKAVLEITTKISLDIKRKVMILAMAIRLGVSLNGIHSMGTPSVQITPSAPPKQWSPAGFWTSGLFDHYKLSSCYIRAAGYNEGTERQYYDVINTGAGFVELTMEVNNIGEIYCFTGLRELVFMTSPVLLASSYEIIDPDSSILIKFSCDRFDDSEGNDQGIYIVESKNSTKKVNPTEVDIYDHTFGLLTNIAASDGYVAVNLSGTLDDNTGKKIILSYAMRAGLVTYGFHRLPMPHIQYFYGNDKCDKPFLL